MSKINTHIKKPCADCPFRKDSLKGWLGDKMEHILTQDNFVCHKTAYKPNATIADRKQCAGFMLLKGENSQYVQLAQRLGIDLDLQGRELVFETEQDCINHHKNKN